MTVFFQTMTREDFREALGIHYYTFRMARIRPALAVGIFIAGVIIYARSGQWMLPALCIAYACWMFAFKRFYVWQVERTLDRNPLINREAQVTITDDDLLLLTVEQQESRIILSKLEGYALGKQGVLIYPQRNMFILLQRKDFPNEDTYRSFCERLQALKVRRLS